LSQINQNYKIAIVGLGYVGLPLLIEFSKKYKSIGYDINKTRVHELNAGIDITNEVSQETLLDSLNQDLLITDDKNLLSEYNVYIITVPTPVTNDKLPNLKFLKAASKTVANFLNKENIVIYESTVYPGCTEEICVPILENQSKLEFNKDFFCGYSPERINPGDKVNTITKIKKVTSGSTPKIANIVDNIYKSVIDAGTHLAPSIKVAEASKAIENAQRDLNISFMNELALIFDKMEIDTNDVLEAARTKWNFLNFKPGLVGGHCISVDPYYLTYKSRKLGYEPKVILSGRDVNNKIGHFIADKTIQLIKKNKNKINSSHILVMGLTFKENCPDIRNSQVPVIIDRLADKGANVSVYDPYVDKEIVLDENISISLINKLDKYDGIIIAVAHDEFKNINFDNLKKDLKSVIFDVKGILDKSKSDSRL
jgi:UDP-N-acetyl-D-galactosamine dehydrogenase|tara:strand:+ start:734 stop:2011 length:1278 start_codon:yes stop_codon:yes gene_type:complete